MRIDNARITGSILGSQATAELSGSFTGSGHIDIANTASKLSFSASYGLGIENTFVFDGSSNQAIQLDTASAHFISGAIAAASSDTSSLLTTASVAGNIVTFTKGDASTFDIQIDTGSGASTGSLLTTASIDANNIITFTKGDGTTFPLQVNTGSADTASMAVRVENTLDQGLGIETFSYDGDTAGVIVQVDTSSVHFTTGVSASQATTLTNLSASFSTSQTALSSSASTARQALSASASTSRDAIVANISGAFQATSASLAGTINTVSSSLSASIASLSGSASAARDAISTAISGAMETGSFVITASISASTGDIEFEKGDGTKFTASIVAAQTIGALTQGVGVDALNYNGSGPASVSISGFSASIEGRIGALETGSADSGSASAARDAIANAVSGSSNALSGSASAARDALVADISGSSNALSGSASAARDALVADISGSNNALSASASTARDGIANAVSGAFQATSASFSTSQTALSSSASTARQALSASASTSRDAIVANISGAFQATSASFSTSQTNLSASNSTARENYYVSSSVQPGREEDTVRLVKGNGTIHDVTLVTSSFVKTVNTSGPDAQGNVAISLASVRTGTSASMLAYSSSGNFQDGDVWVISGESGSSPISGSGSNGITFIYAATGSILLEIASLTEIAADSKYVNVSGDTMTGNLVLPAANPTLANEATRKGYVDLFYDSSSLDRPNAELELHKGDGTVDIISLAGISVSSSISASYLSQANGVRIESTTAPNENFIELRQGAGDLELAARDNIILNMDTNAGGVGTISFRLNGTQVAGVDQDGTGSFNWVDSTSSYANSLVRTLSTASENAGIIGFEFDGSTVETIAIDTGSAIFTAGASASLASIITNLSASQATSTTNLSASVSANFASASNSEINSADISGSRISGSTFNGGDLTGEISLNGTLSGGTANLTGSFVGSISGSVTNAKTYNTSIETAAFNFVQGTFHVITTAATGTLPASPNSGDRVAVMNLTTGNPVVARNGSNIMALAQDMSIDSRNASFQLLYTDATNGWVLLGANN